MSRLELGSGATPYIDGGLRHPEAEKIKSVAIGVLIVGVDPGRSGNSQRDHLFWTIRELNSREETQKTAGQISVPAETRKIGEDRYSNLLGALTEFCNDGDLDYIRKHLFIVDKLFKERGIPLNGNFADLSILVYDGDLSYPFSPLNAKEVCSNGWLSRADILGRQGVRSGLRQALELDMREGLTIEALQAYYGQSERVKPAFPLNFKLMEEFYRRRETFSDVPLTKC